MGFLAGGSAPTPPPVTYYPNPALAKDGEKPGPDAAGRAARRAAAAAGYRDPLGGESLGADPGPSGSAGVDPGEGSGQTEGRGDRGSGYGGSARSGGGGEPDQT